MNKKPQFTKNALLSEILQYPRANKVLTKYNVPCLSCPFLGYELGKLTIGEVGETYNIDLDKLLKELNSHKE